MNVSFILDPTELNKDTACESMMSIELSNMLNIFENSS